MLAWQRADDRTWQLDEVSHGCQDAQGSERRNREAVPALFEIVETAAGI